MRLFGVLVTLFAVSVTSSVLGAGVGLVVGGVTGLVWGAITSPASVIWLIQVGLGAGALVGAVAGINATASLMLARRVGVPQRLTRIAVALPAAVAGVAAAALSFGNYLAFPVPTLGGIFAITALAAGLALPLIDSVSQKLGLSRPHGLISNTSS